MPFSGELMCCIVCGKTEYNSPDIESQWRGLEVDDSFFYACPDEFLPDGSSSSVFKTAYQLVISCCLNQMTKAAGGNEEPAVENYRMLRQKQCQQSQQQSKEFGKN